MGPNRQFWRLHFFGFQDAAVHTHTHTHTHKDHGARTATKAELTVADR